MATFAGGEICTNQGTFTGADIGPALDAYENARTSGALTLAKNMIADLTVRPCRAASDAFIDALPIPVGAVPVDPDTVDTCAKKCIVNFRCSYDVNSSFATIVGTPNSECNFSGQPVVSAMRQMCGTWGVASQISTRWESDCLAAMP